MHTGPGAHFSARAQGLGHRYRSRILARVLKKRCVHISAQRRIVLGYQYPGTKCEHTLNLSDCHLCCLLSSPASARCLMRGMRPVQHSLPVLRNRGAAVVYVKWERLNLHDIDFILFIILVSISHFSLVSRGPFLESPGNSKGPKSNIEIKI